ncbi:hypothetical protein K788_0007066 (plasmid) [Paraburkholderia caribensis MBA4]|uniref:Uncharacterized protein n=1 Tax=Paraburkholderia caribensis MBA4 TaxID=1323664 RepID=A0A0P0RRN9_9BURK|nr:hypothetical protein [Paraburkholderia caribensis]ALL71762.1 hypothetical protein K788_0007066 [Paraburkholderia caribensis MBA4]
MTDLESAGLLRFEGFEDGRGYAVLSEVGALFGFGIWKQPQ